MVPLPSWEGRRPRLSNRHPRSPFQVGEIVCVFYEQVLYKAKILGKAFYGGHGGGHWRFFVHYMGWKKSYNEWVFVQRVLKLTDQNSALMQQTLDRLPGGVNWKSKAPKKPQTLQDSIEKNIISLERKLLVNIPPRLYVAWVEDMDISLHLGLIHRVPTLARTVEQIIIQEFRLHLEATDRELGVQRVKKLANFVSRFDVNFLELRYSSELETPPPQHLRPSQAYGVIHILRMLFGKLPEEPIEGGFEDLGGLLHYLDGNFQTLLVSNQQEDPNN